MAEKNFYDIKYIPTGFIFNVAKEECERLVKEEPHNFVIVDKAYKKPIEKPVEVKNEVYDSIVEEEEPIVEEEEQECSVEVADDEVPEPDYEAMKVAELKAVLDEKGIEYAAKANKAQLLDLLKKSL